MEGETVTEQAFREKLQTLSVSLSQKATALNKLISLAEQEREAILTKNVRTFKELLLEKQKLVKNISSIEEEIAEIFKLAKSKAGTITEEVKNDFANIIEKVDNLFKTWGEMEKANMQLAQTYRLSLEKEMSKVKKVKNVVNVYKKSSPPKQSKHFDQEV